MGVDGQFLRPGYVPYRPPVGALAGEAAEQSRHAVEEVVEKAVRTGFKHFNAGEAPKFSAAGDSFQRISRTNKA